MTDTSEGHFPDAICTDCGKKGCLFIHWGRLVPDGVPHGFCRGCFDTRQTYYRQHQEPMPLPVKV